MVAALAVSSFAFAGGDIAPVEPVVETPAVVASDSGFYVGLGYSSSMKVTEIGEYDNISLDWSGGTYLAGYQFNKYFATEIRYLRSSGSADHTTQGKYDADLTNLGLYIKGMYPIGDFTPYVFAGYAKTTIDLANEPSYFEKSKKTVGYGVGVSYSITENIAVFADVMYNNIGPYQPGEYEGWNGDLDFTATTFGVTYMF